MRTVLAEKGGLARTIDAVLITGLMAGLVLLLGCVAPSGAPTQTPLSPAVKATPQPLLTLRIGMNTTPIPALTSSVLWLARDLGYYQREGLDVDIAEFTGAPVGVTALETGQVDVGNLGPIDAIRLNASHALSLRAIGASGSDDFSMIVSRDSIRSIRELKGKSYAISRPGGADDTTIRHMLAAAGVSDSDVNFVIVGAPNLRAQALLGGQIDATTVAISTWVTLRDKPGLKLLATPEDVRAVVPNSATLNVVTTQTLNTRAEELRRFTAAIMKTARLFQSDRRAWVNALSTRRPDLARGDLEYLWDQFTTSWGVNGYLNLAQLQKDADFAYQTTPDLAELPRISLTDWVDTRLVDAALEEIGVYPQFDDPGRAIT